MTKKDFFLKPFRKYFHPPAINTPISTMEIPPIPLCMTIIAFSFIIITGGFIYCWVHGVPMFGGRRTYDGRIVASWYDASGLGSQFLAEGVISSCVYTIGALSIFCAVFELGGGVKNPFLNLLLRVFSFSAPVWVLLAFLLFRVKIPSYSPNIAPF